MGPRELLNRPGNASKLGVHHLRLFLRQGASFPLQPRVGRNDTERGSAFDFPAVQRRMPEERVRRPGAQLGSDAFELSQRCAQWQNGVDALLRPAAVSRPLEMSFWT